MESKNPVPLNLNEPENFLHQYLESTTVGVRINQLIKSFGNNTVLKGLELEIKAGETIVILGKSGAGKTILISHHFFLKL